VKKITSIGYKEEGKAYYMPTASAFRQELDALPPGKYQHVVEKYKRIATHSQFKYLYSVVYPLSMIALNNAGYEFTDIDQIDSFWKSLFAAKPLLNRETGEIMTLPLSKSEFVTIDEATYTDAIRNYCSEYLNNSIPDADPNYKANKKELNDFTI
jgi:hypothetical protein